MTDIAVAPITKPEPVKAATPWRERLFLVLGLAFVLGLRVFLYVWNPDRASDFDNLYHAAAGLLAGENPYPGAFPYPLPAVLLALPFTALPLGLARPVFDILVGWAFVYALWRFRGPYALLALISGAYLFAMLKGQTTPLMVAASLIPVLGFLLAVRPNSSAPLWAARPRRRVAIGAIGFLFLSLVIAPTWPKDWWMALQQDTTQLVPPILRPFGLILLLGALRWRSPEGRLLLAIAFIPQSALPYELVSLALIPGNLVEMGILAVGSWITVAIVAEQIQLGPNLVDWTRAAWPATLAAVYLPMLYLVIRPTLHFSFRPAVVTPRKPRKERVPGKERRRPNRLDDDELRVDVTPNPGGGVTVRVTHLPTKASATESGQNRELTVRKAQDKLAGILAGRSRPTDKGIAESK